MSALKTLAALMLVVSPASLGIAAYTGAVDLSLQSSEEPDYNGEIIEEFTGTFDEEVTEGTLDLRVDRGAVRVIGWDKPEYRVIVIAEPHEEAELSDYETTVEFKDRSSGSTIDLKAIADREGTYRIQQDDHGVQTGEHVDLAIVAWVPASADYTKVRACSGQDHYVSGAWDTVEEVLGNVSETEREDHGCVPAEDTPSTMGHISINHESNSTGLNVTTGVVGLHGDLLWAFTDYGSIDVEQVTFETVRMASDYGGIDLVDVTADRVDAVTDYGTIDAQALDTTKLKMASDYGDLTIEGEAEEAKLATDYGDILVSGSFDSLDITTDYGDVAGDLDVRASGTYDVRTDYGDVMISVPAQDAIGYDVEAATDHGDVEIDLVDARREGQAQDEDEDEHDDEEAEHVRTRGFDDRAIQVEMDITTDYGDVTVGHDLDVDTQDEDDDRDEDAGQDKEAGPADTELAKITTELR